MVQVLITIVAGVALASCVNLLLAALSWQIERDHDDRNDDTSDMAGPDVRYPD